MKNSIFVLFAVLFAAILAQNLSAQDTDLEYAQDPTQSKVFKRRSSSLRGLDDTSLSDTSKTTSNQSSTNEATSSKSTKSKVASKQTQYDDEYDDDDKEYIKSLRKTIKEGRRSYGFLGFKLGFGSAELLKDYYGSSLESELAVVPTIIGGASFAINEYFDLRYYVELGYANYKYKYYGISLASFDLFDLAMNLDFSWRFYTSDIVDVGVFAGLRADMGMWFEDTNSLLGLGDFIDYGFGLNLGADAIIANHHGVRFDVYIPFGRTDTTSLTYTGSFGTAINTQGVHFGIAYFYAF